MILADNQPYFIPYIGYWQLMNMADVYVIADDDQYMKNGWVNRNRIITNRTNETFLNLELVKDHYTKAINERYISDVYNAEKKLCMIQGSYRKAPFFQDGIQLMNNILLFPEKNLAEFLIHSIYCIREYLGITTPIFRQSELNLNKELRGAEMIYETCERLGANTYYNAIGGQKLYEVDEFKKHGIELGFLKADTVRYRQFGKEFIPNLSILDVIMFNSKEEIVKMLDQYTIVK